MRMDVVDPIHRQKQKRNTKMHFARCFQRRANSKVIQKLKCAFAWACFRSIFSRLLDHGNAASVIVRQGFCYALGRYNTSTRHNIIVKQGFTYVRRRYYTKTRHHIYSCQDVLFHKKYHFHLSLCQGNQNTVSNFPVSAIDTKNRKVRLSHAEVRDKLIKSHDRQ
jgi:hypothetical protein